MTKEEEFFQGLDDLIIAGRDDFYTQLMWQELPLWMNTVSEKGEVPPDEVKWLVSRRGFNSAEASKLVKLSLYLTQNVEVVKEICLREYLKANEWSLNELARLKIEGTEDHILIKDALKFAKLFHEKQLSDYSDLIDKAIKRKEESLVPKKKLIV